MSEAKIIIIDDDPSTINSIGAILNKFYDVRVFLSGIDALENLENETEMPDLILLDIGMKNMDGYQVCEKLKEKESTKGIPVIFLTAKDESEAETLGFEKGGVDYIKKPANVEIIKARVKTHIELKKSKDSLAEANAKLKDYNAKLENYNEELEDEVKKRTIEIEETKNEIIVKLSGALGKRSDETSKHVERVRLFADFLAEKWGLNKKARELLWKISPLHDIGKIGVRDNVLNKEEKLTYEEFEEMKQHSKFGFEILGDSKQKILKVAATVAFHHHERWDGTGYPEGLKGNAICLLARITSIADVFDALSHKRCYRPEAWTNEEIVEEFKWQKGKQFDPRLVDIFLEYQNEFFTILKDNPD